MPPDVAATDIEAGTGALREGRWAQARDAFRAVLDHTEDGQARLGLADACWWLGDLRGALEHRERGYAVLRRERQHALAAAVALRLCFDHRKHMGDRAVAAGWLARARRLIDTEDLDPLRGHLQLIESYLADDLGVAEDRARDALAHGQGAGDLDLELRALSQLGATLMAQGRVADGAAHLDEAMAGALAQEGSDLDTVVFASCNMMVSCTSCADFERAVQWIRAAERFSEAYGCPFLLAECRTHYGAVLVATGAWARAEDELRVAIELTEDATPSLRRQARAALAELRLAQGRVEDAERLVGGLDDHPETGLVLARLHLQRSDPERAVVLARRHVDRHPSRSREAELLEVLSEAELAVNGATDPERGARVAAIGDAVDCDVLRARGRRLAGRALAASGDVDGARRELDAAAQGFLRLEIPLETARTRLALAQVLGADDPDSAVDVARTALDTFEDLGARRDVDRVADLLRFLGVVSARTRRRTDGELTEREAEVLSLLGEGLSNPDIADRLVISRKTVEHHVSRVLAKLGADNRAEAAVMASRRV